MMLDDGGWHKMVQTDEGWCRVTTITKILTIWLYLVWYLIGVARSRRFEIWQWWWWRQQWWRLQSYILLFQVWYLVGITRLRTFGIWYWWRQWPQQPNFPRWADRSWILNIWNILQVTGHKWVRPVPKARYRYHVKGFKIKINTKHGTGTMLRRKMSKYSNRIHKMSTPQAFINTYVPKVPSEVRDSCKTTFLEVINWLLVS